MCKIIAVCNQKGGVAKTTTSMNLGIGLARKGKRVLMVDFDPQGDLTAVLGWRDTDSIEYNTATALKEIISGEDIDPHKGILKNSEGVDLLPGNIDLCDLELLLVTAMNREHVLRTLLAMLAPEYDYIIIDCMPSLGLFTVNAFVAADEVLIPMNAGGLSFRALKQMLRTIIRIRKQINGRLKVGGILLTMVRRDNSYTKDRVAEIRKIAKDANIPIYDTCIPFSIAYEKSANSGHSIFVYDEAGKEHKQAYMDLVEEVLKHE